MDGLRKALGAVWRVWKKVGHTITRTINLILLLATYILAIGPVSIFLRLLGQDLLDTSWKKAPEGDSWWIPRDPVHGPEAGIDVWRRQF